MTLWGSDNSVGTHGPMGPLTIWLFLSLYASSAASAYQSSSVYRWSDTVEVPAPGFSHMETVFRVFVQLFCVHKQ